MTIVWPRQMAVVIRMRCCGDQVDKQQVLSGGRVRLYLWATGCLLLALAFLSPVQTLPWVSFYKELLAAGGLAFWLLAAGSLRLHASSLVIMLLVGSIWLQYAVGIILFRQDALLVSAYLLAFGCSIEVGINQVERQRGGAEWPDAAARIFWICLVAAALISGLVAFRQWLGVENPALELSVTSYRRLPYANLGQRNQLASLLLMGLAGILFLWQKRWLSGWASLLAAFFLLVALALTFSRFSWLFIWLAFAWLAWSRYRDRVRLPWLVLLVLLFCFFICVLLVGPLSVATGAEAATVDFVGKLGESGRLVMWKGMATAILHGPWFGYGWGQTALTAVYGNVTSYGGPFDYSHNLLLDICAWIGPWAGMLLILPIVLWLARLWHRTRAQAQEIPFWLGLGAFLTHAMFEFPFAYLYFLVPAGFMLGHLMASASSCKKAGTGLAGSSLVLGLVLMIVFGVAGLVQEYRLVAQSYFNAGVRAAGIDGFPEPVLASLWGLDLMRAEREVRNPDVDRAGASKDIFLLERVSARLPVLANQEPLLDAYVASGRSEDACKMLARIEKYYSAKKADELASRLVDRRGTPVDCGR